MKSFRRRDVKFNLAGIVGNVLLAATLSVLPVSAQQIITDGNTATNLNVSGTTTTVTTTTTKGANAFNSFSKFNVDAGNKVELVVPDASTNLINLVHDEASIINGTLNSIKSGQVGGNIFLVNPHGITVGAQGVINVGSLTAVTPTTSFMNTFFNAPGDPADASITALINGTAPINAAATIDNAGKINAITDIKIDTGVFINSGEMYTDANYGLDMGDIVNLNTLDYVVGNDYNNLTLDNGSITINTTGKIQQTGKVFAGNDVNINSGGTVLLTDTIVGDTVNVTSTAPGVDGPAEIRLGSYTKDLLVDGDLTATANNGNIYYYGGEVKGNANFTTAEAYEERISLALGRFRPLDITGNLTINSAGHVVYFDGLVGGNVTVDSDKMVGFMNVNIGGDLDVDAQAFGFFGGSVGGDVDIDAYDGVLLGLGSYLNVSGNVDLNSDNGYVGYQYGNIGGHLDIRSFEPANIGNLCSMRNYEPLNIGNETFDLYYAENFTGINDEENGDINVGDYFKVMSCPRIIGPGLKLVFDKIKSKGGQYGKEKIRTRANYQQAKAS